jgi:hypothetical protein
MSITGRRRTRPPCMGSRSRRSWAASPRTWTPSRAMFAERRKAYEAGILSAPLYTNWEQLNTELTVIKAQAKGTGVDTPAQAVGPEPRQGALRGAQGGDQGDRVDRRYRRPRLLDELDRQQVHRRASHRVVEPVHRQRQFGVRRRPRAAVQHLPRPVGQGSMATTTGWSPASTSGSSRSSRRARPVASTTPPSGSVPGRHAHRSRQARGQDPPG